MESVFTQTYDIKDNMVDCQGYLKPSQILFIAQDMGGRHCKELTLSYDDMAARGLFWAVSRHRVQITRLPMSGETIRVETWAMPATAAASTAWSCSGPAKTLMWSRPKMGAWLPARSTASSFSRSTGCPRRHGCSAGSQSPAVFPF